MPPELRLFGIRHHGPGSAANLREALAGWQPDVVLLECPADAEAALQGITTHPDLQLPVSLLIYNPRQSGQATFLPFAEFSPEWQALRYCQQAGAHLRCMDLPMSLRFAFPDEAPAAPPAEPEAAPEPHGPGNENSGTSLPADPATDPLGHLARLEGYTDGERWWEARLEHAPGHPDVFQTVLTLMTALREASDRPESEETLLREAFMREALRATLRQGYQRIAVVCGAWHAPVLQPDYQTREDKARLKGLPKVATEATWVPWTYERLSTASGYGAGVLSPAWYELLFTTPRETIVTHWMVRAARLLRGQDLEASSAHAIEAVRLAHTLAAVRELALPGIDELEEAAVAIFGRGYPEALQLVHHELVIGSRLGEVPPGIPATPLQQDLARQQKALRLKPEATPRELDLDLRRENDLERSHLLHRLALLEIQWGEPRQVTGKSGTFHELWSLHWRPELGLAVIEAGLWGNTVQEAAVNRIARQGREARQLDEVSPLVERALLASLSDAIGPLVSRLETLSADTRDATHLLRALPPLVNVLRYGNVRRTETTQVARVVHTLVPRLAISLPLACANLDADSARDLRPQLDAAHQAIRLLQDASYDAAWFGALRTVLSGAATNGLLAGFAARLLFDARQLDPAATATVLGLALAPARPTDYATAWIEGFLTGSGLLLIHNRSLFDLLHLWLSELREETFRQIVPLLRRAFAGFTLPERRQVLELASTPTQPAAGASTAPDFDLARGLRVLPVLRRVLSAPPA